jgi:putative membrane protein
MCQRLLSQTLRCQDFLTFWKASAQKERPYKQYLVFICFESMIFLIVSAHIAGFIGLQWEFTRPFFEMLVPFNLLLTAFLVFAKHTDWSGKFIIFSLCAGLGGFFLEVAGVATKVIFGNYWYETVLGVQLWSVPLTIALNWWVLIYVCGVIAEKTNFRTLPKVLIGASLMTFLDYWIEPVAMKFHFWNWADGVVPLQNYVVWFLASCLLLFVFYALQFRKQNVLAYWVYGAQLAFFMAHNIFFWVGKA